MIKNAACDRFLIGLFAAFPAADSSTRGLYRDKLSRWSLSDDVWARALSRVVGDYQGPFPPPLADLYRVLKDAERSAQPRGSGAWEVWTAPDGNGQRIARRIDLDRGTPAAPDGARDYGVLVDDPARYHQCTRAEAREAFRAGWIESGADPGKLAALWPVTRAAPHLELVASDYGDPEAR